MKSLILSFCAGSFLFLSNSSASLVAYYSFDDGTATDLSGNGNHGSVGGSLSFSADRPGATGTGQSIVGVGTAGVGGIVTVPTSASLESIVHELTFSSWIKADAAANANWVRIARKGDEANGNGSWMVNRTLDTDELNLRVDSFGAGGTFNQNIGRSDDSNVLDNTWHHVAYTLSNGNWVEYINGSQVGSGTYNHGVNGFANTEPFLFVGRGSPNLVGAMDDLSIWSHALSPGEISQLASGIAATAVPEPLSSSFLVLGGLLLIRLRARK